MQKFFINIMLVTAILLAACGQASPTGLPAATDPTATIKPAAAALPTPGSAQAPVATEDANTPKMDCQVVSMSPTQGATEVSMFPPPSEGDWILGKNPGAPLTITEYSDFQ